MPILKEHTLSNGLSGNYWRVTSIPWQENLVSAELVANPAYNSENPEPETIANPDYIDAETTPDEPETIANPAYEPAQIWSPTHQVTSVVTVSLYLSRDAYYEGKSPITSVKATLIGDENPFRSENLGQTYGALATELYQALLSRPMFEGGELIA